MKTKFLFIILVILALGVAVLVMMKPEGGATEIAHEHSGTTVVADQTAPAPAANQATPRIPAYQSVSEVGNLHPTLPSSQFVGKAREAYEVAKKIPQTLAQLPCYCECDLGFGHKSLHTCFENDHASGCAVCVDEALLAYKLQKEQKLTPEQVREKIVEQYSASEHQH